MKRAVLFDTVLYEYNGIFNPSPTMNNGHLCMNKATGIGVDINEKEAANIF